MLECKDGPNGTAGGVPFPEVQEELDRMGSGGPLAQRWLMKLLPRTLVVKKMREFMGFPNQDIAFDRVTTRRLSIPGPDGDVPVRVYTPEGTNLPLLVYFHGGGWIGGSVDTVENICRGIADRAGCIAINVDYRLAPEHRFPAGLEDCYAAVEWAHAKGRDLGGDPERLVVAGDSAGGNLATVCCLLAHERHGPRIGHQVLVYPGVDLSGCYAAERGPNGGPGPKLDTSNWIGSLYVERKELLADPRCSPWLIENPSFMPPALLISAEYCFIRDQGEAYAEKLAAAGVPVKAIRYNGVGHAFLDKVGVWKYADECIEDIGRYLAEGAEGAEAE